MTDITEPGITSATILEFIQNHGNFDFLNPLMEFAGRLPPMSGNILELYQDGVGNRVDFSSRISRDFDYTCNGFTFPDLNQDPSVFFTSAILRQYTNIENVWIEYDAPFNSRPALFFDIDRSLEFNAETALEKIGWLAEYFSMDLHPGLFPFFEKISSLGLSIVYYGFMFSRHTRNARLTITGFRADEVTRILKQLGWKGNYFALEFLLDNFLNNEQSLKLAVDVGESIAPRIGLEVADRNPADFGEKLVKKEMLSGQIQKLLRDWPLSLALDDLLRIKLSALHRRAVNNLFTRINHIKFILNNSRHIQTKAYLYYCF